MSPPELSDADQVLWFKIADRLSTMNGGAFAPKDGDSIHVLEWKVAMLVTVFGF